jgi:DNA-binding NtrC family response regulator
VVNQWLTKLLNERYCGYTVFDSENAGDARAILDREPEIKLLFTDVVMPGVNGRKLADEAAQLRPNLKVLYTTGYTPNAVVHGGVLDAGVHLLSKPFTLDQLAAKVRAVLDE